MMMNKYLSILVISATSLISISAFAQDKRKQDPSVRIDGEIEFEVGDTKIKIGSKEEYNGKNHSELESRVRRLERAIQFLMENNGFRLIKKNIWECSIETPFDGIFSARSDSEASAKVEVVNKCNQATRNGIWCKSDNAKCSRVEQ